MSDKVELRQLAPDFEAQIYYDSTFKTIRLSEYLGQYVILFFYPLNFTFVCPTEILALNEKIDEFHKLDC